jgi:hypothetical protein
MPLNEDSELSRTAIDLAQRAGESFARFVENPLEERPKPSPKAGLAERLMKIAAESAPLMNDGRPSKELLDELYDDETGLPK